MNSDNDKRKQHVCIVNVGLYRSGTTTLIEAARRLGMNVFREFPVLSSKQQYSFLENPEKIVTEWYSREGLKLLLSIVAENQIICDGYFSLLPFLPQEQFDTLEEKAKLCGIHIKFVATMRDVHHTVISELQHWIVNALEEKAGLTVEQRERLEHSLRKRAEQHRQKILLLNSLGKINILKLSKINDQWPQILCQLSSSTFTKDKWARVLRRTGRQNANPNLPIEGILLTMRLSKKKIESIETLLNKIEIDSLCSYLVVFGIDADQEETDAATELIQNLKSRVRYEKAGMQSFHVLTNPERASPSDPFQLCKIWNNLAIKAWENKADWVLLLGDDIDIKCQYHY